MLRVIYLDRGAGRFAVTASGTKFAQALGDSDRWKTAEFAIDRAALADGDKGAPIGLEADGDLTLHMIEVARTR